MFDAGGVLAAPGMGSVFLLLVLLCYLIISKIIKTRKEQNDVNMLSDEILPSPQPVVLKNNAGIVAAISAAVNEYRKYNP